MLQLIYLYIVFNIVPSASRWRRHGYCENKHETVGFNSTGIYYSCIYMITFCLSVCNFSLPLSLLVFWICTCHRFLTELQLAGDWEKGWKLYVCFMHSTPSLPQHHICHRGLIQMTSDIQVFQGWRAKERRAILLIRERISFSPNDSIAALFIPCHLVCFVWQLFKVSSQGLCFMRLWNGILFSWTFADPNLLLSIILR